MVRNKNDSPRVEILLASYNGEKYLPAQIESILEQNYENIRLFIRDDGSTDGSLELIEKFAENHSDRVSVLRDCPENQGATKNFLAMIHASSAEYIMFADQDDVWLPDKVLDTLAAMKRAESRHGKGMPILVHTDLVVVDHDLLPVFASFWDFQKIDPRHDGINRLLVQNVVTGCTVMINRSLCKLVRQARNGMIEHDWWLALIAAAFGKISFVPRATMLYRQHEKNAVGAKKWNVLASLKKILSQDGGREFSINLAKTRQQAACFAEEYAQSLTPETIRLVSAYATLGEMGFAASLACMLKYRFFKIGLIRNLGMILRLRSLT